MNGRFDKFFKRLFSEVTSVPFLHQAINKWKDKHGPVLAVSGSTMQRLIDISKKFALQYNTFLNSDVDIYCRGKSFYKLIKLFHGLRVTPGMNNKYGDFVTVMVKIPVDPKFRTSQKYMKLNLVGISRSSFSSVIGNFDFEYLSCLYSGGEVKIIHPVAFITGLPSLKAPLNPFRLMKYKRRGFPCPDSLGNNFHLNANILSAMLATRESMKFIADSEVGSTWSANGFPGNYKSSAMSASSQNSCISFDDVSFKSVLQSTCSRSNLSSTILLTIFTCTVKNEIAKARERKGMKHELWKRTKYDSTINYI
jgi:hypothetical protein